MSRGLGGAASTLAEAAPETLPFPVLDALLGASSSEFFSTDWQRSVRVFPSEAAAHRLTAANFDFRAVVAQAAKAGKLEDLGKDRPGPRPGEPGWPETQKGPSARVTRAQSFAPDLAKLCERLTEELSHRISANLYVAPPLSRGLDRHQDGHDVLILQVEGRKRWKVWTNDAPPPLDSLPALTFEGAQRTRRDYRGTPFGGRSVKDSEIAGKREWSFDLAPGEMIYVPRGFAHDVWTEESHSAHLTFGFHLVSWIDVLMTVVAQASRRHGEIRESLPIGFARVGPAVGEVRHRTRQLLALLNDTDGAEALEEVIGRWLHRDLEKAPQNPKVSAPKLVDHQRLRRIAPAAFVTRPDSVGLFRASDRPAEIWLPAAFAKALRFVATVEPPEFEVRDVPGMSPSSRTRLCEMLIVEGYLEIAGEGGSEEQG